MNEKDRRRKAHLNVAMLIDSARASGAEWGEEVYDEDGSLNREWELLDLEIAKLGDTHAKRGGTAFDDRAYREERMENLKNRPKLATRARVKPRNWEPTHLVTYPNDLRILLMLLANGKAYTKAEWSGRRAMRNTTEFRYAADQWYYRAGLRSPHYTKGISISPWPLDGTSVEPVYE